MRPLCIALLLVAAAFMSAEASGGNGGGLFGFSLPKLGDVVDNTLDGVGDFVDDTLDKAGIVLDNTVDGLGHALDIDLDDVGDFVNVAVGGVGTLVDNTLDKAGNVVDHILDGADDLVDEVGHAVVHTVDKLPTFLHSIPLGGIVRSVINLSDHVVYVVHAAVEIVLCLVRAIILAPITKVVCFLLEALNKVYDHISTEGVLLYLLKHIGGFTEVGELAVSSLTGSVVASLDPTLSGVLGTPVALLNKFFGCGVKQQEPPHVPSPRGPVRGGPRRPARGQYN